MINENFEVSFSKETISIVYKIVEVIFFCHKYIRIQKTQNILDKVFENNKLKNSQNKLTQYYIINDDLSTKIIKKI
jgi:capsular polysaccharide biosynthesis protein